MYVRISFLKNPAMKKTGSVKGQTLEKSFWKSLVHLRDIHLSTYL
jgi:predicted DNA-binding ribbon-helix-helix protein